MHHANIKTRDSQNPYRTGVLVGNYVEDKFGIQEAVETKSGSIGVTENNAQYSMGSTLHAYNLAPRPQEEIMAEREYKEFQSHLNCNEPRGVQKHLFFGHGAT